MEITNDDSKPPFAYKVTEVKKITYGWRLEVTMPEKLFHVLRFSHGGSSHGPVVNGERMTITFTNEPDKIDYSGLNPHLVISSYEYSMDYYHAPSRASDAIRNLSLVTIKYKFQELLNDHPTMLAKAQQYVDTFLGIQELITLVNKVKFGWVQCPNVITQKEISHLFVHEDLFDHVLRLGVGDEGNFGKYKYVKDGRHVMTLRFCPDDDGHIYFIKSKTDGSVLELSLGAGCRGKTMDVTDKLTRPGSLQLDEHIDIIKEAMSAAHRDMSSRENLEGFSKDDGWTVI